MRTFARCLAVPMFIGAFVCMTASFAQAAFPGENGKLVISINYIITPSNPDGGNFVATFNPDGSDFTRLAPGGSPAWSPDGKKIAFVTGSIDVYVMDENGLNERQVTDNSAPSYQPAWSPDGQKIVFVNGTLPAATGAPTDLHVVRIDGTGQTNLTNTPSVSEVAPAWSVDGKIAFVSDNNIFVMNGDGSGRTQLTNFAPEGVEPGDPNWSPDQYRRPSSPNWSPDGSRLVYALSASRVPGEDIYDNKLQSINADGSGVTDGGGCCKMPQGPVWSPDGRYIVSNDGYGYGLFITGVAPATYFAAVPDVVEGFFSGRADWQPIPAPKRGDYRRAAQFCKALRAFLGDVTFTQRYKNHGRCASENH
jgi:Tol biopolymer transport system component